MAKGKKKSDKEVGDDVELMVEEEWRKTKKGTAGHTMKEILASGIGPLHLWADTVLPESELEKLAGKLQEKTQKELTGIVRKALQNGTLQVGGEPVWSNANSTVDSELSVESMGRAFSRMRNDRDQGRSPLAGPPAPVVAKHIAYWAGIGTSTMPVDVAKVESLLGHLLCLHGEMGVFHRVKLVDSPSMIPAAGPADPLRSNSGRAGHIVANFYRAVPETWRYMQAHTILCLTVFENGAPPAYMPSRPLLPVDATMSRVTPAIDIIQPLTLLLDGPVSALDQLVAPWGRSWGSAGPIHFPVADIPGIAGIDFVLQHIRSARVPRENIYLLMRALAIDSGPLAYVNEVFYVLNRPKHEWTETVNGRTRLHNDSGPAILWRDQTKEWFIHGVRVDRQIVMAPETQGIKEMSNEPNQEVKRIRIERYGWDLFLGQADAKVLDQRRNDIENTREVLCEFDGEKFLLAHCTSTPRVYALRVPREVQTCDEAQIWLHSGSRITNLAGKTRLIGRS